MDFGERLIFAREKKGLTQKKLSELLEVTPTRLNYWEKNKREPNIEMIFKLSQILDISTDFLIGLESLNQIKNTYELSNDKKRLLDNYDKLNEQGKEKAIERVEELTHIDKYIINNNKHKLSDKEILELLEESNKNMLELIAFGGGDNKIKKLTDEQVKEFEKFIEDYKD